MRMRLRLRQRPRQAMIQRPNPNAVAEMRERIIEEDAAGYRIDTNEELCKLLDEWGHKSNNLVQMEGITTLKEHTWRHNVCSAHIDAILGILRKRSEEEKIEWDKFVEGIRQRIKEQEQSPRAQ